MHIKISRLRYMIREAARLNLTSPSPQRLRDFQYWLGNVMKWSPQAVQLSGEAVARIFAETNGSKASVAKLIKSISDEDLRRLYKDVWSYWPLFEEQNPPDHELSSATQVARDFLKEQIGFWNE